MPTSFVFLADTHLDLLTYQDLDMRYDTYVPFEQAITECIARNCDLVVAGDFWECNPRDYPQPVTVRFYQDQCDRMEEAGLKIYYVYGQHDRDACIDRPYDVGWPMAVNARVSIPLTTEPISIGGLRVLGIHSQFPDHLVPVFHEAAKRCDGSEILICHQRWSEMLRFANAAEGSLKDIPETFKFVITGDLHKPLTFQMKLSKGKRKVISPGATCRRAKDQPDKTYMWFMHDDKHVTRKRLQTRPVLRLEVNDVHDVDRIADKKNVYLKLLSQQSEGIDPRIAKPIVYVSGSAQKQYTDAVAELFAATCHVRCSARTTGDTNRLGSSAGSDVSSRIDVRETLERIDCSEAAKQLLRDGLRSNNPLEFIKAWRDARV